MDAPEELERLYQHVQSQWEDERAHLAFLEVCASRRQLAIAAHLYRARSAVGDPRREWALARITSLAMLQLETTKSARPVSAEARRRRALIWTLAVSAALLLGYLLLLDS